MNSELGAFFIHRRPLSQEPLTSQRANELVSDKSDGGDEPEEQVQLASENLAKSLENSFFGVEKPSFFSWPQV